MPAELAFQHCHPCGESVDHPHLLGDLARSSAMTAAWTAAVAFQIRAGIGDGIVASGCATAWVGRG